MLRTDHLNDVTSDDVFLGLRHIGQELFLTDIRFEWNRRHFDGEGDWMVFTGLFEQRNQPFDFGGGILVGFFRAGGIFEDRVHQDSEGLSDAIKDEQLIRNEEIHDRSLEVVMRRARHNGLDVVDKLVPDEANRAAGETRKAWQRDRPILFQDALHDLKAVSHAGDAVLGAPKIQVGIGGRHTLRRRAVLKTTGPTCNPGGLDQFPVFEDFHPFGGLANHRPRITADKGIASEMFSALDGFEQERFAWSPDLPVSREGGFDVSQQAAGYGNDIALLGEFQEVWE